MEMSFKLNLLYNGSSFVLPYVEDLNNMNVFPVPDGDTGSNLYSLFHAIKDYCENERIEDSTLREVILTYSRGNSGAIFSQFILSFWSSLQENSPDAFIQAIEKASLKTFQSVAEPKEGTILTVMESWVSFMKNHKSHARNIKELLGVTLKELKSAVEKTKEQMEILRKNDVVDAGAYAFYLFVKGMASSTAEVKPISNPTRLQVVDGHELDVNNRYCVELVIKNTVGLEGVRKELLNFGDSLSIIGDKEMARIHIHSNAPERIVAYIKKKAFISHQKIDDMVRQYEVKNARKSNIAIVIDSACDVPTSILDEHQVHLIPLQIDMEGVSYLDKVTLTPETFYDEYEKISEMPKTSQPSIKKIKDMYTWLVGQYDHVISLHVSKELSGTYNLCKNIAKEVDPEKIHVVNSKTLSGSYGLLVVQLAKLIEEGFAIEEVLTKLNQYISKTEILVSVPTLKYMVKGGRVSPIVGKIGKLLNLKPIVSVDGEGKSKLYGGTVFRKSNIHAMLKQISSIHEQYEITEYVLLHANHETLIPSLEDSLSTITGKKPLYISNVSPVIGIHAGKGSVSVAMVLKKDNER
ncbi:DegV family protein [Peribacillus acanthi]|uniref:DegV family protein n=1 Tax=Peribacillus acanthi TaxID=2171554 RepID=UPI0014756A74|nr:DegV family protein [Peribacillus acanthi]